MDSIKFLVKILQCLPQNVPQACNVCPNMCRRVDSIGFWRKSGGWTLLTGAAVSGGCAMLLAVFWLAANGWLGLWLAAVLRLARFPAWWLWLHFARATWLADVWLAKCLYIAGWLAVVDLSLCSRHSIIVDHMNTEIQSCSRKADQTMFPIQNWDVLLHESHVIWFHLFSELEATFGQTK